MNDTSQNQPWKSMLIGVVAVAAMVGIAYLFIAGILNLLSSTSSDLAKAIVTASAAAIISVFTLIISKRLESRSKLQQDIRGKKTPCYEKLVGFMFETIFHDKLGKEKPSDQYVVQNLTDFAQRLIIWGSDDVIKAYGIFRNSANEKTDPAVLMGHYESLLKAMRKDLGHSDNLQKGVLLSLFTNKEEKKNGQPAA